MNRNSYHPMLQRTVSTAYGLTQAEAELVLTQAALVSETDIFLKAASNYPTGILQVGINFVSRYFGDYRSATTAKYAGGALGIDYYNIETSSCKIGRGVRLFQKKVNFLAFENINGSEVTRIVSSIRI